MIQEKEKQASNVRLIKDGIEGFSQAIQDTENRIREIESGGNDSIKSHKKTIKLQLKAVFEKMTRVDNSEHKNLDAVRAEIEQLAKEKGGIVRTLKSAVKRREDIRDGKTSKVLKGPSAETNSSRVEASTNNLPSGMKMAQLSQNALLLNKNNPYAIYKGLTIDKEKAMAALQKKKKDAANVN